MSATITLQSLIQRNEKNLLSTRLGDEMVMMNLEAGDYLGINAIGSVIWEYLSKPAYVKDIIAILITSYEVSPEQCELDTLAYLQNLADQKVIHIKEEV